MLQNYTKISNDKIIVQNFILQIDAEVGALVLVADAFFLGVAVVAARARVHRCSQHKPRRVCIRRIYTADIDLSVFKWLS